MILYLIRHAKSSWAESGTPDHDRPLNERGRSDAPRVFARLVSHGAPPELIVSSTATRAAATAKLLLKQLDAPATNLKLDERLYAAGPDRIVSVARELPDNFRAAAIVGHNPGMTYAANRLAADLTLDNLPTCGVVGIRFDVGHWADVEAGVLCYLDYPKKTDGPLVNLPKNL